MAESGEEGEFGDKACKRGTPAVQIRIIF